MAQNTFLQFIELLAEKSGEIITHWYDHPDLVIDEKSDETPVTIADRNAEAVMRDLIRKHYPHHGIIGEEYGRENDNVEYVWVLDPIDGTISFSSGSPLFGTLICLLQNGQPILGAIHQPVLKQLCIGDGKTTTLNGRAVAMRETAALSQATLLTTDIANIEQYQDIHRFNQLHRSIKILRTWGDCYGYLLLATGKADIMLDPIMNPWDLLALIPIIRGAGGVITDWQGNDPVTGKSTVAAGKNLHAEVLKILDGSAPVGR